MISAEIEVILFAQIRLFLDTEFGCDLYVRRQAVTLLVIFLLLSKE